MPTLVRSTVDEGAIDRIFKTGDGWTWMKKVGQEQMFYTLEQTPVRTGDLRRSFNLALTPNGKYKVRYTVGTYSPKAKYVIFGTTPPIYGSGKKYRNQQHGYPLMLIKAAPHSWFGHPTTKRFVDGQPENDFMSRAAGIIMSKYG
jgi:hypothetical protein